MTKTTNGYALVAWSRPAPTEPVRGTWEGLAHQMEASEPALAELRRLLAVPVHGNTYDPADPLRFAPRLDFVSRRKIAQTFAAAVVNELHGRRMEGALANVHALIDLARLREERGMLVEHLIHAAIAGLAVSATWECLQAPGWTDAQLASLQSAWQPVDFVRGFESTVEMERAFGMVFYEISRTNAVYRRDIFRSFGGGQGMTGGLYDNIYLPIWASMWSKGDELHFLEMMQPLIEGVRRDVTNGRYHALRVTSADAMRDIPARRSAFNRFRFPVVSMVVPNWEKAATTLLRYETQRQLALTALALKRHQLKHGKLPADLAALIPEFLPSIPFGSLSGRPFIYLRLSANRFVLRSIGDDERDEQGAGDDPIWPALESDPAAVPAPPP
jgi:hypothetical protein